jgi:hypothetical protein
VTRHAGRTRRRDHREERQLHDLCAGTGCGSCRPRPACSSSSVPDSTSLIRLRPDRRGCGPGSSSALDVSLLGRTTAYWPSTAIHFLPSSPSPSSPGKAVVGPGGSADQDGTRQHSDTAHGLLPCRGLILGCCRRNPRAGSRRVTWPEEFSGASASSDGVGAGQFLGSASPERHRARRQPENVPDRSAGRDCTSSSPTHPPTPGGQGPQFRGARAHPRRADRNGHAAAAGDPFSGGAVAAGQRTCSVTSPAAGCARRPCASR